ncbi:hypothetical protein [Streptomyces albiflavescens]|uniref:hypothetical protein n=1 Tax=Streptomyces albiflavescens TaxID=1623582 RepID=UPI00166CD815|nr:hypothetical protein [Streptomyces albiflavescens]
MTEPPSPDALEAIAALLRLLGGVAIKKAQVPRPIAWDLLTFDEIIRYFVDERPDDPQVHHGALLTRHGLPMGVLCLQLFVDQENKPCLAPSGSPYGRVMAAKQLDRELEGMLAGKELIIFE